MGKVIGIDLGNSTSSVAIYEGDRIRMIETSLGKQVPSIVSFTGEGKAKVGGEDFKVGELALNNVRSIKTLLGSRFSDDIYERTQLLVPYQIVKSDNGDAWINLATQREDGKKVLLKLCPQEVIAKILRFLKDAAQAYCKEEIKDAVISCPANFNHAQRQAIIDAATLAGLNVRYLINDTTATAISYSMINSMAFDGYSGVKKILVYDFGGGEFDASIIKIGERRGKCVFEVVASTGVHNFGGDSIDNKLVEYLNGLIMSQHGLDLRGDLNTQIYLRDAAERAKIELSTSNKTTIILPYASSKATGSLFLSLKLSSKQLEQIILPFIQVTTELMANLFEENNISPYDIDDVVMVGAQTRSPIFAKALTSFFNQKPYTDFKQDESVVVGAAIYGGVLDWYNPGILVSDNLQKAIGIVTVGSVTTPLVRRNTKLPFSNSVILTTSRDGQSNLSFNLVQGNQRRAEDNVSLGTLKINNIEMARAGEPQLELKLDIDENALIRVDVRNLRTGETQDMSLIDAAGLGLEQIQKLIEEQNASEQKQKQKNEAAAASADSAASDEVVDDLGLDSASLDELKAMVLDLRAQNVELKHNLESANKRGEQELEREKLYGTSSMIENLLPVYDALEQALDYAVKVEDGSSTHTATVLGMKNTLTLFVDTLKKQGVEIVDPTGKSFDPNLHEAAGLERDSSQPGNIVLKTMRKGFVLNGRLVRAAMVVVNKG